MSFASGSMCVDVRVAPQFTQVLITQVTGYMGLCKPNKNCVISDVVKYGYEGRANLIDVVGQTKFRNFQNVKSYVETLKDRFLEVTNTKDIEIFSYDIEDIEPAFLKGKLKAKYKLLQDQIQGQKQSFIYSKAKKNTLLDNGIIKTDYNLLAAELEAELKEDLEAELKNNNYEF